MNHINSFNIIIAGTGGQGVNTLTDIFWKLCEYSGYYCTGAVFKGGAQRMGTVYSEIRIFFTPTDDAIMYSSEISPGCGNLIIGMEPWETLRYKKYINSKTVVIVNSSIEPFYLEREEDFKLEDPVKALDSLDCKIEIKNYTNEADKIFKNKKMVNYLIGIKAIKTGVLPFTIDSFNTMFIKKVFLSDSIIMKIKDYK